MKMMKFNLLSSNMLGVLILGTVVTFFYLHLAGAIVDSNNGDRFSKALADIGSKNPAERQDGAEVLGELKDKRAVELLIRLLNDRDTKVRQNAAYALGQLGDVKAVRPLIKLAQRDSQCRHVAIQSLGLLPDAQSKQFLLKLLKDKDSKIVFEAVKGLESYDDREVVEALVAIVQTSDDYACQTVVDVLGKKKAVIAVEPLADMIRNDSTRGACVLSAIAALGWIGDNKASPALQEVLGSPIRDVGQRCAALQSLGRLQADDAFQLVMSYLKDSDWQVRKAALDALIDYNNPRAVPAVRECLTDENQEIRDTARFILKQFGYKS